MKITGNYEGLWNTIFVRPLGFIIVKIGELVGSTAISIVIITLILRTILYPMTRKTILQSENMKKASPEIARIEKKYENKTDSESMTKKGQEMMMVYKKYDIKPLSGCLFAFIQLPILLAFWEAINRVPAIFEEQFLGLNMGTTPITGIVNGAWYYIIVCIILIAVTYFHTNIIHPWQQTNKWQNNKNNDNRNDNIYWIYVIYLTNCNSILLDNIIVIYNNSKLCTWKEKN